MDNQGGYSCLLHTNRIAKELGTIISTGNIGVGKYCMVVQIGVFHETSITWINLSKVFILRTFYPHNNVTYT